MTVFESFPGPRMAAPSPPPPLPPPAPSPPGPADPPALVGLPSAHPTPSFWLETPSPLLRGFRSTPDLPATTDVVVVGSGITGAFAADVLAGGGTSVLMLDAREACWGATGRNGGHCQPLLYGGAPDVAAFELATFRFLRRFVARHAVPCDWRSLPSGGVHAYLDGDLFAAAAAAVADRQATDPALGRLVRVVAAAAADREDDGDDDGDDLPGLRLRRGAAAGAIVQQCAASLWPYQLVAWVLERLVGRGSAFNLQTNTPVLQLRRRRYDTHPWIVSTPRGDVAARTVLLATNGYTAHLVPALADLIVPVRGQVAALRPSATAGTPPSPLLPSSYILLGHDGHGGNAHRDRDEYLIQRPVDNNPDPTVAAAGGLLIFGGGRQRAAGGAVGEWRDDAVEPRVARYLRTHLAPVVDVGGSGSGSDGDDDDKELPAALEWSGIMGFSRDQHPWVGRVPASLLGGLVEAADDDDNSEAQAAATTGLYLCAGYTGHGMPVAALAARSVARTIRADLGESASSDWTDLSDDVDDDDGLNAFTEAATPLPAAFTITETRIRQARAPGSDTVRQADARGLLYAFQQQRFV